MEIFSQYDLHNIFKIFTDEKKYLTTESLKIKSQSCDKFPVFRDVSGPRVQPL